jgi:hypothetical protein
MTNTLDTVFHCSLFIIHFSFEPSNTGSSPAHQRPLSKRRPGHEALTLAYTFDDKFIARPSGGNHI